MTHLKSLTLLILISLLFLYSIYTGDFEAQLFGALLILPAYLNYQNNA